MGAPTKDVNRKFPDGISRQQLRFSISGLTDRPGAPKGESVRITPKREVILDLDPTMTAYDAAGIENVVVALLNDVQVALARERGEEGV